MSTALEDTAAVYCEAPGCNFRARFTLESLSRDGFKKTFHSLHGQEYDEGRAPSISVDWEPVADCSFCGRGRIEVDPDGDGGVKCDFCGSFWNQHGEHGETDPDRLAEIFAEAWDMAHVWAVAGRDDKGHIRMTSGHGTLVAEAGERRDVIQGWLNRATPGSRYWMQYRAALDLLDREAEADNA